MKELHSEQCVPCRGSETPLSEQEIEELRKNVPEWDVVDTDKTPKLRRRFRVADFRRALNLANQIGEIAEAANHHPRIVVEWGRVSVSWWTHAIGGLHRNDFIMAARTDRFAQGAAR